MLLQLTQRLSNGIVAYMICLVLVLWSITFPTLLFLCCGFGSLSFVTMPLQGNITLQVCV